MEPEKCIKFSSTVCHWPQTVEGLSPFSRDRGTLVIYRVTSTPRSLTHASPDAMRAHEANKSLLLGAGALGVLVSHLHVQHERDTMSMMTNLGARLTHTPTAGEYPRAALRRLRSNVTRHNHSHTYSCSMYTHPSLHALKHAYLQLRGGHALRRGGATASPHHIALGNHVRQPALHVGAGRRVVRQRSPGDRRAHMLSTRTLYKDRETFQTSTKKRTARQVHEHTLEGT